MRSELYSLSLIVFFFQAEDGIRDSSVTGVQTCALPPNPTVATKTPSQSTCLAVALRLSGIRRSEIAITAAASGILMKNAQRQEACSISQPPRIGPAAVVIAVKPDQVPIAWPRVFSSKHAPIIDKLPGTRKAAPIPWPLRAITSC